jgi:hypothetical protein
MVGLSSYPLYSLEQEYLIQISDDLLAIWAEIFNFFPHFPRQLPQ